MRWIAYGFMLIYLVDIIGLMLNVSSFRCYDSFKSFDRGMPMAKTNLTKEDISVSDKFICKFSEMYIRQRAETRFDYKSVDMGLLFKKHGFQSETLEKIITRNSVSADIVREAGEKPAIINDIYRSDLGELLLTYYFEEKIPEGERFKIPCKNITNRELASLPGRGLDAIGYREKDGRMELLVGEAKVSEQKKNPPDVVDYRKDSIYETQKKFKDSRDRLVQRLSDHCRKLSDHDASRLGLLILLMESDRKNDYDIVFGCSLVRDISCIRLNDDFGKFHTRKTDFEPHQVSFCIMNFDKNIGETVDLFYKKVQELCSPK